MHAQSVCMLALHQQHSFCVHSCMRAHCLRLSLSRHDCVLIAARGGTCERPPCSPRSWHGTAGGGDEDERCEARCFGHDNTRTIQTDYNWTKTRVPADFIEYGARLGGSSTDRWTSMEGFPPSSHPKKGWHPSPFLGGDPNLDAPLLAWRGLGSCKESFW